MKTSSALKEHYQHNGESWTLPGLKAMADEIAAFVVERTDGTTEYFFNDGSTLEINNFHVIDHEV